MISEMNYLVILLNSKNWNFLTKCQAQLSSKWRGIYDTYKNYKK